MCRFLALLFLLTSMVALPAQAEAAAKPNRAAVTAAIAQGQTALDAGDFTAGIAAFQKATELDPDNGRAWQLLGYCLHAAQRLDEALVVHQKAAQWQDVAPVATYNIACVHSLKGNKDLAIEWLQKAVALGFSDAAQLAGDTDFDSLREDPRFQKIAAGLGNAVQVYAPTTDRRSVRLALFQGRSSPGQVAVDYAVLAWQETFAQALASTKLVGKKWRLGGDFWTTLDTSVPLQLAGVTIPAGYWYLTLEQRAKDEFVLGVHDPVAVRKLRIDPYRADRIVGGIEVALQHRAAASAHKELLIGLRLPPGEHRRGEFVLGFGPHELHGELVLELDDGAAK